MVAGPSRDRLPPRDGIDGASAFDGPSSSSSSVGELYRRAKMRKVSRQASADPDANMSSASFFIPSLPGQPSDSQLTMYGGHIPTASVSDGASAPATDDGHAFFFLVRNKHIAETERTVIWFNGGPGCSSFDGAMMEIGPFRLVPGGQGKLTALEGAWNEYANVLFVDQPVGTGFSYISSTDKFLHELEPAAQQMINFLQRFYKVFPEFANHDTYLAGESFAGQYIPYFASAMLATTKLPKNLKGVLIGNGWIDPLSQYPAYLDFAVKAGVLKAGSKAEAATKQQVTQCLNHLKRKGTSVHIHNGICEAILGSITSSTVQSINGQSMCVNNYDVRLTDVSPACGMNWPPDLADIYPYLRRADVKAAFHANRQSADWIECNGQVGANFWVANSAPAVTLFPDLLTQIPMLVFAGDQDLICNHVGIEYMIDNLEWNGGKGFGANVTAQDWYVDGKLAGTWTTDRNLTYVKIHDASHMVPYDKPVEAHDMLLRFIGVNLLGAAGPAAQVPSKVGDEQEAVVGETHVNGTAVAPAIGDDKSATGSSRLSDDSFETIVNAGAAALLLVVMLLAIGIFFILRRRITSRKGPILGHQRGASLGRGQHLPTDTEDDPHELDELVVDREYRDKSDKEDYRPVESRRSNEALQGEEIFDVGSDDEDRKYSDNTK